MDLVPCATKNCPGLMHKSESCCDRCHAYREVKRDMETVVGRPIIDVAIGSEVHPAMLLGARTTDVPLHVKYPKYHKAIPKDLQSLDVYAVCYLFPVDDPSGCINHARKKLLVPGVRTGGKSMYKDVMEARDTLNRWLELNVPSTDVA